METILLTGATGFLGSYILKALIANGYNVIILKRSSSDVWRIRNLLGDIKSYNVDIVPLKAVFQEQKIDIVIHTACSYGRANEPAHKIAETNLLFSLKLLDNAIESNSSLFVNTDTFFSADQQYLNYYALSKKQFVEWLRIKSKYIQVINLKLQHIYGPKDSESKFVTWLSKQFLSRSKEIKLTKGEQRRDFVYVDDAVSAYLLAIKKRVEFSNFLEIDVATGELLTLREFVEIFQQAYKNIHGKNESELLFGALPYKPGELMDVDMRQSILLGMGWTPKMTILSGAMKILEEERKF